MAFTPKQVGDRAGIYRPGYGRNRFEAVRYGTVVRATVRKFKYVEKHDTRVKLDAGATPVDGTELRFDGEYEYGKFSRHYHWHLAESEEWLKQEEAADERRQALRKQAEDIIERLAAIANVRNGRSRADYIEDEAGLAKFKAELIAAVNGKTTHENKED